MKCLVCEYEIESYGLCPGCMEDVWSGSDDAESVINILIDKIKELDSHIDHLAGELRALAPRPEPEEILF